MTKDEVRKLFEYKDGNLIWLCDTGTSTRAGTVAGYLTKSGYVNITYKREKFRAHRLIYLYHHGHLPKQIDHINRVKNDNRIENLRATTSSANQMNTADRKESSRGVYLRENGRWRAQIYKNNTAISLGHFDTREQAQSAYSKAKAELYPDM